MSSLAYHREWRRKNRGKSNSYSRKWRQKNKSKMLQLGYAWRKKNKARYLSKRRATYALNAERRRKTAKAWRAKRKAQINKYFREYRKEGTFHYIQHLANVYIQRMVKVGTLKRPSRCSLCKEKCKPEAHHYKGYARQNWIDIKWLCIKCHNLIHHPKSLE